MVEVYWFSEQPYGFITDQDLAPHESGRMHFSNSHFDPLKAHVLYQNYHDQYAWADQNGFDGIMSNEHHSAYWCMKPSVNIDGAVIAKVTKRAKIALLGNVIALNDPVKMAEELAMLDCISGGRLISGFVRGTAVETLHAGISPTENRDRFEEAHDLILKCWTTPGPFRWEGRYFPHRMVNPWVLPIQKPHPPIWFPGTGSPESVIWAAQHQYPYMNLGALLDLTIHLKNIYHETAHEMGYEPGPQHFGYLMRVLCADTDEKAYELGKTFLWTQTHRQRGPIEFNDPPGYQSREALRIKMTRPMIGTGTIGRQMSYDDLEAAYNIVVGSPETVIKKLRHVRKELNPGYILIYGNEGNMPHEDVMRSVELLGTKVIPAIKED